MAGRGFPLGEYRCVGKSRQSGERCKRTGVPFTDPPRCIIHGGNQPEVRAKAEARMKQYDAGMLDPSDPPWLRRQKVQAWERANERYQVRRMKKAGTYDEWLRAQAQIKAQEQTRQQRVASAPQPATEAYDDEDMERWSRW